MNRVNIGISLFGKDCIFGAKIQTTKNYPTVKTTISSDNVSKNDDDNTATAAAATISETSSDIIIDREMTLTEDSETYAAEAGI